jgi:diacylglycerol kinase family enzyme
MDANPKQDVSIDGDVLIQTPINVVVARKALLVIIPASETAHKRKR